MRLFYAILFTVLIGIVTLGAYHVSYNRFEKSELATSSERLSLYQESLRSTINRVSHLPRVVVSHPYTAQMLRDGTRIDLLNQYLKTVSDKANSAALYILDANATTVAASNFDTPESFVGNNYRFRRYFIDAVSYGQATFFAIGVTTGRPGYFLSEAIVENGELLGVAVVKVEFTELLEAWRGAGEDVLITDRDDVTVLASDSRYLYKPLKELPALRLSQMRESKKFTGYDLAKLEFKSLNGVFEGRVEIEGEDFSISTVDTSELGWKLHFLTPLAPVQKYAYVFSAFVLLFCGLMASVLMFMRSREKQGRLQAKANEAERVSKINTQLEQEVQVRKETEKQLRDAQSELIQSSRLAALGKMSAAIVHEVNQPVSAIRLFTSSGALLVKERRLKEAGGVFEDIKKMTERLGAITSDLLIFSRKPVSSPQLCDLNESVENILLQFKPEIEMSDIEFSLELADTPVLAKGSKVRFEQIISNLIKNAIQACEESPSPIITLKTWTENGRCGLSVRDNGKGIPDDIKGQLFDPFFTTKNIGEGVGLGLALCYAIADEANGKITCENLEEGGALFKIEFPAQTEPSIKTNESVRELVDG
jgi:two-component system C4-dicarboxylate transport sensor histidine kinase DctB